jgi:serine/threonine protein phosphatase PrpC
VVPGHLAVSRSIGDTRAKPIVTADPEVQSMLVDATWRALVLATDGLWDVVTPALCAEVCLRSPSAHHAADQLVDLAISMKSTDNVSVMVVMLRA